MLRIFAFLALVFAVGLGFAWLADRPGEMTITFGGYQYQISLMVAAVMMTAVVTAVMLTWWLLTVGTLARALAEGVAPAGTLPLVVVGGGVLQVLGMIAAVVALSRRVRPTTRKPS